MLHLIALALSLGAVAESPLVTPERLAAMESALAVDARASEDYLAGHIPGATNLDVDSVSEERDGVINLLRPHDELKPLLAAAGLDPARTVVVYSGMEGGDDLIRATRLFWTLEYMGFTDVRLLDGGLAKWKAEGLSLENGASTVPKVSIDTLAPLTPRSDRYKSREDVQASSTGKKGLIVDLRSREHFAGAKKSGYIEKAGHIPGAKSQPASELIEGDFGTFKTPEVIRELLSIEEIGAKTPVVTYCNSGRSATIGYVAYRIAGFENVAVYDGSMAEWGNRADCPVAAGGGNE